MDSQSRVFLSAETPVNPPDPEASQNSKRRRFSAEYKLSVLRQADACSESGGIAALLRREGLCSSHLAVWRGQRHDGFLQAIKARSSRSTVACRCGLAGHTNITTTQRYAHLSPAVKRKAIDAFRIHEGKQNDWLQFGYSPLKRGYGKNRNPL